MNTPSASPADGRVLVWDAPVRVFHWLLAASFAGAWLTAESETWRLVHVTLGYTLAGLVAFRVVWGLVGTRHARFSDFVRGPADIWRYLRSLATGHPEPHAGHNPAGALAIVGLLVLAAATAATGWANDVDLGGEWVEELHEGLATAMLVLVVVHVAGVLIGSFAHRENLVRAMVTGRRAAPPAEAIRSARRWVAVLLVAAVAGFWAFQWQSAGSITGATGQAGVARDADD
ncbi:MULTISPECIES: cytochrome b/b6 domain-containing protein [Ramlibacter]|uniref:Cytochrome b/b6 domain-containing protein n=1 Tax=Ramlibacter aquaticus TaxID=2780094 RepID=A0ABR9SA08_9BURK|nr:MULTISPECIES: cytochrome b/b6 domain-containing protein [Ramlibacter]MBE7939190.1 cytochrome b/b6 domain-containing protein [Ramlibacter aquaticus]